MDRIRLEKDNVYIEIFENAGVLREQYWAKNTQGNWIHIASDVQGGTAGASYVEEEEGKALNGYDYQVSIQEDRIVQEFAVSGQKITRTITIEDSINGWIKVNVYFEGEQRSQLHAFYDQFCFEHEPTWSYAPSLMGFIPDAQYKAPLVMIQSYNAETFAIVPDVTVLSRDILQQCSHSMSLDVRRSPSVRVGFIPTQMLVHAVFCENEKEKWLPNATLNNSYYLLVSAQEVPHKAYSKAVRFHWKMFGAKEQLMAAEQQKGTDVDNISNELWESWRRYTWENISVKEWLAIPLEDGTTGGAVGMLRWGGKPSVYFSSWFNAMRSSFGMALYAKRTDNQQLMKKASDTLRLVLNAPGVEGAFKCFAVLEEDGNVTWGAGDGCGGSTQFGYLGFDMCWTGYWLLKWHECGLPTDGDILRKCDELAWFMIKRQNGCGMFPTFFDESGDTIPYKSDWVTAETGPVVLFLLQLYQLCPKSAYLEAAMKGLEFIIREVIPTRQWFDFETFWSCCSFSNRDLDMVTGQYPANNLALISTVDAFQMAHSITGNEQYLEIGKSLLDYLLLFQQCWTNPVLEGLSCDSMLLGGFTTQNIDAEWSDARQSQAGTVILNYYRKIGGLELLQRGIAALRAQFPVSPSENWAHWGYGPKTGVTSFHWGTGSGMAGIEMEHDFLMDAAIDVKEAGGAGVNGLNLSEVSIDENKIIFHIHSPFQWKEKAVVKFYQLSYDMQYEVYANNDYLGSFSGELLSEGLEVNIETNEQYN